MQKVEGTETLTLNDTEIEPFTQRPLRDLCQESFTRGVPHVLGRVEMKDAEEYALYDARHLCKYMFELVISKDGRKVRMKNLCNPLDDRAIKSVYFYEIRPEAREIAHYIGAQKDFLESSRFRSRIFNRNDPFDALSINFVFKDKVRHRLKKKTFIPVVLSVLVLLLILMSCAAHVIRDSKLRSSLDKGGS